MEQTELKKLNPKFKTNQSEIIAPSTLFRPDTVIPKSTRVYWFNEGGLGDYICRVPALKYVLTRNPQLSLIIYMPRYMMFLYSLFLVDFIRTKQLILRDDDTYPDTVEPGLPMKEFRNHVHTSMGTHLIAHSFNLIADETPDDYESMYYPQSPLTEKQVNKTLDKFKIGQNQKYILLTPSFTSKVREWPVNEILKLALELQIKHGILPVFVGSTKPMIESNRYVYKGNIENESAINWHEHGLNLLNRTELHEVLALSHKAQAVCGVDNGLLHLAACTPTPIVFGYTTVKPFHRRPFRNPMNLYEVLPDGSLTCKFCQSNMRFFIHDFRHCIYEDQLCTKQMTAEKFLIGLKALKVVSDETN